jgi:hypothetical protein
VTQGGQKTFSKLTYLKDLRGHEIPRATLAVLIAVFNYTDKSGQNAHPGEKRLAEETGRDERTVRRHLKWLTDHGYLVKASRGHSGGRATVYDVALPDTTPDKMSGTHRTKTVNTPDTFEHTPDKNVPDTGQKRAAHRTVAVPLSDPLSDPDQILDHQIQGSDPWFNTDRAPDAREEHRQALIERGKECFEEIREIGVDEFIKKRTTPQKQDTDEAA